MATDEPGPGPLALYRLLTWLSPAYPVGAYSYSHGLEFAVEDGRIGDGDQLVDWVRAITRLGSGRVDAILLAASHRAAGRRDTEALLEIAMQGDACRPTSELALETSAQGRAFLAAVSSDWSDDWLDDALAALRAQRITPCHPVAVGTIASLRSVPLKPTVCAYLQSFVANLVSAAVRLIPLGQSDGVRALERLEDVVLETTHDAVRASLDDIGTATPMIDILSARHETQYSRLFRS